MLFAGAPFWAGPAVDGLRRRLYETFAPHVVDETDAAVVPLMRTDGLLPLLTSSDAIREQALLGLAASVDPRRTFIEECFRRHGRSLTDTLDALDAAHRRYRFPPEVLAAGALRIDIERIRKNGSGDPPSPQAIQALATALRSALRAAPPPPGSENDPHAQP